ncbi:hypothetical protein PS3A_17870 [Pseudomonas sp. 3A(2025)]
MRSEVELVLRTDFLSAVEHEIRIIGGKHGRRDWVLKALLARTAHMRVLDLITVDEAMEITRRANAVILG